MGKINIPLSGKQLVILSHKKLSNAMSNYL